MSDISNTMEKKSFGVLSGVVSGFTMGNEFNSISKVSILCGTTFQEYLPFQDSPEDTMEESAGDVLFGLGLNVLGELPLCASVLGKDREYMLEMLLMGSRVLQAAVSIDTAKCFLSVVVEKAKAFVNTIVNGFMEFVPHKAPNIVVLGFLEGLSGTEGILRKLQSQAKTEMIEEHKKENKEILENGYINENGELITIYSDGEYIENQSQWDMVKYGTNSNMSYSGCEVIATYNALKALGESMSVDTVVDLIAGYERDGLVWGGKLGTSPVAIKDYFIEKGYDVETTTSRNTEIINEFGERNDTIIVTAYNNQDTLWGQIHTVSITKEENGTYSVHNAYNKVGEVYKAKDDYNTLQEAINAISNSSPLSISVIGISNSHIQ